jgi:hypothetical protein
MDRRQIGEARDAAQPPVPALLPGSRNDRAHYGAMLILQGGLVSHAPAKTVEVEDAEKKKLQVENPAYVTWIARDQKVLRFLLNTLSPDILSHLLEVESTAEVWAAINGIFGAASRTKAQHLRGELNDTKKALNDG